MLKGIDVSKWQATTPNGYDFVIARATHGITKDNKFVKHISNTTTPLIGAYHFAKTNYEWLPCARQFLAVCHSIDKPLLLALDIEGVDATRTGARNWVRNWLTYVIRMTGIHPVVYLQSSLIPKYADILKELDCGLWVAHWGVKTPKITPLATWALWQYSDTHGKLDVDYFNGGTEQFKKYMGKV